MDQNKLICDQENQINYKQEPCGLSDVVADRSECQEYFQIDSKCSKVQVESTYHSVSLIEACYELGRRSISSIFGLMIKHIVDLLNIYFAGHINDPEAIAGVGLGILC
mmetsp:Transcript_32831/g.37584  ORF Transcript_32831/g.37584 Transcript_32831/m.37584 type:complete len:108 (-) Transcript_32831:1136-1459(-)